MEKLELLIVQDIYDDTETSEMCDIYLPAVPGVKKRELLSILKEDYQQ